MTSSSSCAATIRVTDGVKSPFSTGRARTRASAAAKSGYPSWVHASALNENQNKTFRITRRIVVSETLDGRLEVVDRLLGVSEQHHRLRAEKQGGFGPCEPRFQAPLTNEHHLAAVDL